MLLKITGLFCKRALQKRIYSEKEPYNFKEPTNRVCHLIPNVLRTGYMYYGVATISRLLKVIGLFCRISSIL